jgi:hypothetical protein
MKIVFFMRFYDIEPKTIQSCMRKMRKLGHRFTATTQPITKSMNPIVPMNSYEVLLQFPSIPARNRFMEDSRTKELYQATNSKAAGEVVLRQPGDIAYAPR